MHNINILFLCPPPTTTTGNGFIDDDAKYFADSLSVSYQYDNMSYTTIFMSSFFANDDHDNILLI